MGKSVNLVARVNSYFRKGRKDGKVVLLPASNLGTKTEKLAGEAVRLETISVNNELEALLLEAKLIKKFKTKFNVVARDDKRPLYIAISKKEDFPRVFAERYQQIKGAVYYGPFPAAKTVRQVMKMLRRVCPFHQGKIGKRKCFPAHLGLCDPCPAEIISMKDGELKEEKKQLYKRQIKQLEAVLSGKNRKIERELNKQMNKAAAEEDFETAVIFRDRLKQFEYIVSPYTPATSYIENPNLLDDQREKERIALFEILERPLRLKKEIKTIEGFDSSHIRGGAAAVSMVTYVNGEPEKSLYRRFKIKTVTRGDDLNLLKEALTRRLKRKDWLLPDLILIDGGATQVAMAKKAIGEALEKVPVIGLAKRFETIVIPKKEGVLQMRPGVDNPGLRLLMRVRDESHRFAQSYHHFLRKKQMLMGSVT